MHSVPRDVTLPSLDTTQHPHPPHPTALCPPNAFQGLQKVQRHQPLPADGGVPDDAFALAAEPNQNSAGRFGRSGGPFRFLSLRPEEEKNEPMLSKLRVVSISSIDQLGKDTPKRESNAPPWEDEDDSSRGHSEAESWASVRRQHYENRTFRCFAKLMGHTLGVGTNRTEHPNPPPLPKTPHPRTKNPPLPLPPHSTRLGPPRRLRQQRQRLRPPRHAAGGHGRDPRHRAEGQASPRRRRQLAQGLERARGGGGEGGEGLPFPLK